MPQSGLKACTICGRAYTGECCKKPEIKEHHHMYDARWRKIRANWLSLHPLCVMCEEQGKATPATVVDHIISHRGDWVKFNDPNNWQSLCFHCHAVKSQQDRRHK